MPYRDAPETPENAPEILKAIADRKKRLAELRALEAAEPVLKRELKKLEGALKSKKLPVLENLRIASPCKADWEKMIGTDRTRFCADCGKNVYNLSAMTHDEAERFIEVNQARECVRFYQRTDGTILTSDCPVGMRRKKGKRIVLAAGATALAMSASAAGLAAFGAVQGEPVMGAVTAGNVEGGNWTAGLPQRPDPLEPSKSHLNPDWTGAPAVMGEPSVVEPAAKPAPEARALVRPRQGRPVIDRP